MNLILLEILLKKYLLENDYVICPMWSPAKIYTEFQKYLIKKDLSECEENFVFFLNTKESQLNFFCN